MHNKFEINGTKIKDGYQSGRIVVLQDSKSDLPLVVLFLGFDQIVSLACKLGNHCLCNFSNEKLFVKMRNNEDKICQTDIVPF